ncbi:MAG: porin [Candidatus Korobacteraceae bacterium]
MKNTYRALVVCLCLMLVAPGILSAQSSSEDMKARVEELEKLILELKAEMASMKKASTPAAEETAKTQEVETPAETTTATTGGRVLIASLGMPSIPASPEKPQGIVPGAPAPASPSIASLLGPTSVQGYVDSYYGHNFNNPSALGNTLYSFNRYANQFGLGLVQLQVDKAPSEESRTGYRVSLGFGQAMTGLSELDPGETQTGIGFAQYLMEGYFSYLAPVGKGLQVDVGKFVTPVGVELIPAKDNWQYSRGLIFSWLDPYFHFGMRAKYVVSDKVAVSGFLLNGWNNILDTNSGKTFAGQISLTPSSKFAITQTYMAGPEGAGNNNDWRQLSDTIVTISPTSKLSLIANAIYWRGDRMAGFTDPIWAAGGAGFIRYAISDSNAISGRYEYLNDHFGFATTTAQRVHGITGTFERKIANNIITRWEYRRDFSNTPFFTKGASDAVKAQTTATAGLMFTFDSREAK